MPGLSVGEIIVILIVGFLIIGPKDLPKIARFLARCYKYVLNLTDGARKMLNLDEELESVTKLTNDVTQTIKAANPVAQVKKQQAEIDESLRSIQMDMRAVKEWANRKQPVKEALSEHKSKDSEEAAGSTQTGSLESGVKVNIQSEQSQ